MLCERCHECEHYSPDEDKCRLGVLSVPANGKCWMFSKRREEYNPIEDAPGQKFMWEAEQS